MPELDQLEIKAKIDEMLNRWPAVGLAVGVVRNGSLDFFHGHGFADIASKTPVTEDTVFRIASITKTFTAVAVMQLEEQGLIDLDAPANDYLHSYQLVPAKASFRAATVRHLLTHTAGVRAIRTPSDLFRRELGWSAATGQRLPLAEYYRGGLHVDVEPGTRWAYSNHGFATLGQIVEDVTGLPLDRYFRERLFGPFGMESSDLVLSERLRPRLATGYSFRSDGVNEFPHRDIAVIGAGSVYSTMGDMARYAAGLLNGGANGHGRIIQPDTLARMFEPNFQPDARLPGMGLAFFRDVIGGQLTAGHDGIWKGFLSDMVLSPAEGIGVLAFANTGKFNRRGAPVPVANALIRLLLDLAEEVVRTDVPEHPWAWSELCGWYSLGPGVLTDPQPRLLLGAGVEVVVRRGQLTLRGQMPVPAVRRGLRLYPDGDDPDAFLLDLSVFGLGLCRTVFSRSADGDVTALSLAFGPMSFQKQPDIRNPRPWINGALAACAASALVRRRIRAARIKQNRLLQP